MSRSLGEIIGPKPLPVGERPTCMFCGAELRPNYSTIYETVEYERGGVRQSVNGVQLARYFTGVYGNRSAFCSNVHAIRYALAMPEVKRRSAEYPKLSQPFVPLPWIRSVAEWISSQGNSWGWRVPKHLLQAKGGAR